MNKSQIKKMNLQLFADKTEEPAGDTSEEKSDEIVLTTEELNKKLQSETDKRVTEALKTAKEKWENEFKQTLEEEKREAERLATLSASEKEKEILKQKEEEINQREQALKLKELELDAINILEEEQLPIKFVGVLLGKDAEETQKNIQAFKREWNEAIQDEMKKRVATQTPRITTTASNDNETLGERLAQKTKSEVKHNFW